MYIKTLPISQVYKYHINIISYNFFILFSLSLNLICSSLTLLISVTLTLLYSIYLHINLHLCSIIGYLMNSFFHGIMYSYVLLSINLFHLTKYHLSKFSIIIEIIIQWFLSFLIPLFINEINFQIKGRFCYTDKISLMILNILTGLFLPIIFILIFNLIIYLHVYKLRMNTDITYREKSDSFRQISSRLFRHENEKYIKLLRQTIAVFSVFFLGWGILTFISIFNRYHNISNDIYLIILSFPSISLLIFTLLIKYWNKSIQKSIFTSKIRHSLSETTVRFSHPININHIDIIQ